MEDTPLYRKIYNDILEGIRTNRYPAGSKLPSEKELSEIYSVSRITSKKALEMLADQRLITRTPGKGSYVAEEEHSETEETIHPQGAPISTKLIGVVMDAFGADYGYQLLLGIERECKNQGLSFILKCTFGSKEAETAAIDELLSLGVEGIIIMCVHGETYNAQVLKMAIENYPIVLIDRQLKGIPISFVGTNNYKASKELTEWLINHGHTNICFVTHSSHMTPTILERQSGFIDCHMEHNLITNETMWITNLRSMLPALGQPSNEDDFNIVKTFINNNPKVTAFFAVEHSIGLIVYKALRQLGMEKEKKVVFFDGIDENSDSHPMFTRVKQGEYLIGINSVALLKQKMDGKKEIEEKLIPYKIIEGKE